jgi:ComF family protein
VFEQARSLGVYDSALKSLIHHFKYQKQTGAMKEISSLLDLRLTGFAENYTSFYIVPIPLHKDKLRERGFDQSYLIARHVAGQLQLPFWDTLLMRIKATESQARKKKNERLENVRGAFSLTRPEDARGKDILLIDDVFTTGATANEAAKVFKRAGAEKVHVFTLARA